VPGAIQRAGVVAFCAEDLSDLTLEVSRDGRTFRELEPTRRQRRLPSPPGGAAGRQRRTMVEYEATVPAENHFLRLRWNGPAEVDRVELRYR
jgi:hypothetical protein